MMGALLLFLSGSILLITVAFFASYLRGNRRRSSV
jgi:hypothetical protein